VSGGHVPFLPARSGPPCAFEADYAVVGSGAGGAAAAVILARAGFQVAVVEAGPWRDPEDYPFSMYGTLRDMFADWGTLVATGDSLIPVVQARLVGGTPVINSAIVVRTPGDVLAEWRDRHGLGDVFHEQAVGAAQDQIEQELQVVPTPAHAMGPSATAMLAGLDKLGMEGHPTSRNVPNCQGVMQCLQGCRNRNKQTANLLWLREVIARGGTVLSCAPVARLRFGGGACDGLDGRFVHPQTRQKGAHFTLRARRGVLLAASATGSAPLLMASGYRHPWLGRGWRAHPGAGVVGVYPGAMDMHRGPSQGAASLALRATGGVKLESLSLPLELFAARVGGAGQTLMRKLADYRRCAMWVSAVRCEAEGRIWRTPFGGTRLRYVPTQRDLARLRAGAKVVAQLHFAMGAERVWPGVVGLPAEIDSSQLSLFDDAPLQNRSWTWVLSHLFGGCVIGADPARSVVAPDLGVRGVKRLHVVDASLLPTTLGVNPQHTIMAVARISAQRLAESSI
jgi:choline dehydrogenase-like flavoprotein